MIVTHQTKIQGVRLLFRAYAAFAKPEVYEYLESRDTGYAMRLPANEVLQRNIRHLLKRPVGRPPKPKSTEGMTMQQRNGR